MASVFYTPKRSSSSSPSSQPQGEPAHDVCFKIFIVVTVALAGLVIIASLLSLMAINSILPQALAKFTFMKVVGEVNSYVMMLGGIFLFVLGSSAWCCQARKENQGRV